MYVAPSSPAWSTLMIFSNSFLLWISESDRDDNGLDDFNTIGDRVNLTNTAALMMLKLSLIQCFRSSWDYVRAATRCASFVAYENRQCVDVRGREGFGMREYQLLRVWTWGSRVRVPGNSELITSIWAWLSLLNTWRFLSHDSHEPNHFRT